MREPKTPLPWRTYEDDENAIADQSGEHIGDFFDVRNKAYAVHAANALPEVLAALRGTVNALRVSIAGNVDPTTVAMLAMCEMEKAQAALAKAEGAPEGDRG